uniref:Uncharacterized protein n=1 Tax=Romanomermis culicivorax TaxID=13658 RepID=A0A915J2G6_ROMCU
KLTSRVKSLTLVEKASGHIVALRGDSGGDSLNVETYLFIPYCKHSIPEVKDGADIFVHNKAFYQGVMCRCCIRYKNRLIVIEQQQNITIRDYNNQLNDKKPLW